MSLQTGTSQLGKNAPGRGPRCVLWHSGAGELPGELLSSLTRRIGRVTVCTEGYAALAEACLVQREVRLSGDELAPGLVGVGGAGVLLLVQPEQLAGAAEIIEAAELYAPALVRWTYDRAATPKLRPWSDTAARFAPAVRPTREQRPDADAAPAPTIHVRPGGGSEWAAAPAATAQRTPTMVSGHSGYDLRPAARQDDASWAGNGYQSRGGADAGAEPYLRLVDGGRGWEHAPPASHGHGGANAGAAPANSANGGAASSGPVGGRGRPPTPVLTDEELRMLLGDDAAPNGRHGGNVPPRGTGLNGPGGNGPVPGGGRGPTDRGPTRWDGGGGV